MQGGHRGQLASPTAVSVWLSGPFAGSDPGGQLASAVAWEVCVGQRRMESRGAERCVRLAFTPDDGSRRRSVTLSYSPRSWDRGAVAWPRDAARQVTPSSRVRLGAHSPSCHSTALCYCPVHC